MLWKIFFIATGIKLLLIPAYKSTDFEVHRNWLAITYNLPITQWYTESTSEWTLDYPPLFAWFQCLLSFVAYYFDKEMLNINNLNYFSDKTGLFMRLSVMFSDLMLVYGCKEVKDYLTRNSNLKRSKWKLLWSLPATIFYILVLNNGGLFIVDHIHFQYNGLLLGILLVSIGKVLKAEFVWGAFWFAVLLNMKHIYLYAAPAYGVYMLKNYCFIVNDKKLKLTTTVFRIATLGSVVLLVTALSFGPFIIAGQLGQVISRLFPFKRGLCHAYWAPNFWAIYNVIDKFLIAVGRFHLSNNNGFIINAIGKVISPISYFLKPYAISPQGSMTSGVLQHYEHVILPNITPGITAFLIIVSILPCLWKLWANPGNPLHFVRSIVICTLCAYMFGWHVHEKAILMAIIPMSLLAVLWQKEAEVYSLLTVVGNFSLLPLIFTPHEFILKSAIFILSSYYILASLSDLFHSKSRGLFPILNIWENIYLYGLLLLFTFDNVRPFGVDKRYPFMPLLLISFYCSLGLLYCTVKYYMYFLRINDSRKKQKIF